MAIDSQKLIDCKSRVKQKYAIAYLSRQAALSTAAGDVVLRSKGATGMRTAGSESLTADVNATTVPAGCTALQSAAKQLRRRSAQQQQPDGDGADPPGRPSLSLWGLWGCRRAGLGMELRAAARRRYWVGEWGGPTGRVRLPKRPDARRLRRGGFFFFIFKKN